MKINKIFHIAIEVPDLKEAIDFYVEKLGFSLDSIHKLPEKKLEVAFLKGENFEIELMCFENSKNKVFASENLSHFQHLAFEVEDINIAMNELIKKGINFDHEQPIPVFNGKVYYNTFRGPGNELLEIAEIKKDEKK